MQITKEQIKRIYALGAGVGILESNNKDDNLHSLVLTQTGKASVSELTDAEFKKVEQSLMMLMRGGSRITRKAPLKSNHEKLENKPGMINKQQQNLAWRYIYRLIELDTRSGSTAGDRMRGAIKKILNIDASGADPFVWVTFEDGQKLIEVLKKYVLSAERKVKRMGGIS